MEAMDQLHCHLPAASPAVTRAHQVALPYPGRGSINSMINICNLLLLSSTAVDHRITFVVTEEWLSLLSSPSLARDRRLLFRSIPNVIPSELQRSADLISFLEAVLTKMESPFEDLLASLDQPPTAILADSHLPWAVAVGGRRGLPVFSFFPMSPSIFSVLLHYDALRSSAGKDERLDRWVPGVGASLRTSDVDQILHTGHPWDIIRDSFSTTVRKSSGVLFNTCYELEPLVIDALKEELLPDVPVYTIGHAIDPAPVVPGNEDECIAWLNGQRAGSVLYVALGSFLSLSSEQEDELAHGLRESEVPFLWVTRGDWLRAGRLVRNGGGVVGMVVRWCNQCRVLRHPAVGAFLTHCGWNSTMEGLSAGKPMATLPLFWDQKTNGMLVVDEWGVGVRVVGSVGGVEPVIGRERVAEVARRVMGLDGDEGSMEVRRRAGEMMERCRGALGESGSSTKSLSRFLDDLLRFNANGLHKP